jgi:hypothetical protein
MCNLAHYVSDSASTRPPDTPVKEKYNNPDRPIEASAHDVNKHLDETVRHMRSLLRHPRQNATQCDYTSWHYKLGHLSHSQLQLLIKQGKLPKCFHNCDPPVCPACLFAKQSKRQWRQKGPYHNLRSLDKGVPGSLTFADQMISTTPDGLIPQSTGALT